MFALPIKLNYEITFHNKEIKALFRALYCKGVESLLVRCGRSEWGFLFFILRHLKSIPLNIALNHQLHQTAAYWLMIRSIYKHPVFYNFTYSWLSGRINVHRSVLRRHIARMIELEWCTLENGVLRFKGINKLKSTHNRNGNPVTIKCVQIPVHKTKSEIILELRNAVIQHNLHRQQRIVNRRAKIVNLCKSPQGKIHPDTRRYIKKHGGVQQLSSLSNHITLGNNKFGSLIGRSRTTGVALQKKLNQKGFIKSKPRYQILVKNSSLEAFIAYQKDYYQRGLKFVNGNIVKQLSNSITDANAGVIKIAA